MKRLVFDLDDTITINASAPTYAEKQPNLALVAKLRDYKAAGFEIIIQSARNMQTYQNSVGKINAHTLPVIIEWLQRHDIPFDEIFIGKPWCGDDGFYIDDRAIRPDEFVSLSYDEIQTLIRPGKR
jgi:capsule biosynthesis phosphatase